MSAILKRVRCKAAVPQLRRMDFQSVRSRGRACKDGLEVHPTQFYNRVLVTTDCAITDVGILARLLKTGASKSGDFEVAEEGIDCGH